MRAAVSKFIHNADQVYGFAEYEYEACTQYKQLYDRVLSKRMKLLRRSLPTYFGFVTETGEGIPEPDMGGRAAEFFLNGEQRIPAVIPPNGVNEEDMKELLQLPHVRQLLELQEAQERAARALVEHGSGACRRVRGRVIMVAFKAEFEPEFAESC